MKWANKKYLCCIFLKNKEKHQEIIISHLRSKSLDDMILSSWDIECHRLKLVIMGYFFIILFFYFFYTPWKNPKKNRNLKKNEKKPRDIIMLHICTINQNHMMYGSWDMEHNREFFLILDHFWPSYPPNNPANLQNMKKCLVISFFYPCAL